MSNLQPTEIISQAKECFSHARMNIALGTKLLFEIKEKELWKGTAESYSEFVEQDLNISKSFAAKLTKSWEHYVVQGGVPEETFQRIDSEKLYLGIPLPQPMEEKLNIIEGNSRRDIKKWVQNEGEECTHEREPIMICPDCGSRV